MSRPAVLAALEGGAWRSGAELAGRLGITRAAVWKQVARLRAQGYEIEAAPGRGYRLLASPDRLLPAVIERHAGRPWPGFRVVHREVVDSTNRLAADLARRGAPEGTAVVAEAQTAGRGRLGRSWASPRARNLYLSLVLRPPLAPSAAPQIALAAALSVVRAIAAEGAGGAEIKWPNDVLLGGAKVAGILAELEAEAERLRFVVLGVGVNLNAREADFPAELRGRATSLLETTGRRVDRARFTGRLLGFLARDYGVFLRGGFAALRPEYERFHGLRGRRVEVRGGVAAAGKVRGVDDDGALLLEGPAGLVRILAGEVTLSGAAGAWPCA